MSRAGRILVIEDLPRWQRVLGDTLTSGGFEVVVVSSRGQASEQLRAKLFHLLIVDLRLEDQDPSNQEGMEFLRELTQYGINESVRVIVLTAYGTNDLMREAFKQHGVSDFWSKQEFNGEEFLADVQRLFREEIQVNLGLVLHWQGDLSSAQAVVNLRVEGQRVKKGTPRQELLALELEDLFCRLFHDAENLLVHRLSPGRSGAGVLLAQPFYARGGGRPLVVKYGDVQQVTAERNQFNEFVQPFVGGGRSTTVVAARRTPRLGGIVYSLVGDGGGRLDDFEGFYRSASLPEIREALDRLFLDTCGSWYENPGQLKPLDLARHYFDRLGMTRENLARGLESLKSVQGKDQLYFQALSQRRPLPNPLQVFPDKPLVLPTYETITHGDFNPHNILLDEQGSSWLIDFQSTGLGHVLRDAVELDVAIRVQLLTGEEASLDERLALEEALARPQTYSELQALADGLAGVSPAVGKAFATCVHLRALAGRLLARHTSSDLGEYYAGALFCALNLSRFLSFATVQREHALLSACLLTERLGL